MLAPWLIEKLREEEEAQRKRDRDSWEKQPRVEVDDSFRRPPPPATVPDDGRVSIVLC